MLYPPGAVGLAMGLGAPDPPPATPQPGKKASEEVLDWVVLADFVSLAEGGAPDDSDDSSCDEVALSVCCECSGASRGVASAVWTRSGLGVPAVAWSAVLAGASAFLCSVELAEVWHSKDWPELPSRRLSCECECR